MSYNNNFQIDYACPGFCSKCHVEIANFRGSQEVTPGVFRPRIESLKPNFRQQTVNLSNESQMMVTVCDSCYDLNPEDLDSLMDSELRGWQKEIEHFGLGEDVKKWVKKAESITITDVPSAKWGEDVRATLLLKSKGIDADTIDFRPIGGGATVSKPFTFSAGAVIIASQHNSNFDTLYNLVNGSLDGTNLASNAAIADTQLGQITTAGKVAGAAITLASTTIVTAATNDYALIGDTSDSGNPKKALVSDFAYTPTVTNALSGSVIQVVNTITNAVATGTTAIPVDDTIPQISEGDEYITRAITPSNASNLLVIIANATYTNSNAGNSAMALFQDATANALAVTLQRPPGAGDLCNGTLVHYMTAGTTSSTTFRIRIGAGGATLTLNGSAGARLFGGKANTSLTIYEIKA